MENFQGWPCFSHQSQAGRVSQSSLLPSYYQKSYTFSQFSLGTRHAVASNQVTTRLETNETSVEIKQPQIANFQQGS
jgi:hypothetical protein